ncbi:hypothetical protein GCM10011613_22420 [Cellvibrio zantedeschiae]|uniref:DUF4083 domain-containing protein n=1 Tax=Cellvibrio zantedeschiae TaxID=1237077 RepID=A0ABQ3B396_9GAMM|nr:hypothetical protein [Cellvibrio zantedeschiae]GGY77392.1 hypothetical protein GCM10011613_22420 [Cellvibrio zantedeschiae]
MQISLYEYFLIGTVFGFFILVWLAIKLITYLRSKRHNRELWGTIFEGATHKLIDLDAIKEPEVFIEKKAKQSGQADDKNKNQKDEEISQPK